MSDLGKQWAGRVYGTNTGNIFVEFEQTEPTIIGRLHLLDPLAGVAVYRLGGSFDERLELTGEWQEGGNPEAHGTLSINGRLTPDGNLRGTWISTIGTGGTFELFPHDLSVAPAQGAGEQTGPEQLYTRRKELGAIRLYADDVKELIKYITEEFSAPRPVVAYRVRGSEVAKYANDFINEFSAIGDLDYLKVTVQEPEEHGLNRLVMVELSSTGKNELLVQSTRESWVVGRSEALANFLKPYASTLVTTYKRFGLNINSVIFLAMFVAIPEIQWWGERTIFVVAVVALLGILYWLHAKVIPNTYILLRQTQPSAIVRAWPTIVSWILAASASLAAAVVFRLITHGTL